MRALTRAIALALLAALLLAVPGAASASDDLWRLLKEGGQVVIMRHGTTTPGVGDPSGFRRDDCATQRNLSEVGREEARRVGAAFEARGIPVGEVLSSQWCRCVETARLAFGRSEHWRELDSLHEERDADPARTQAVRARVSERPRSGNLVLVTHGANILALTGIHPAQGEFLVLTPEGNGKFRVAGRVPPSALPR